MDIENLIFSIIELSMIFFILVGEIGIFIIILLIYGIETYKDYHNNKSIKKNILKLIKISIFFIGIIVVTGLFFYMKEPSLAKIDINRKLKYNELIAKWNLTYITKRGRELAHKYKNYIKLNKNGLCKFSSIDYNSSKYIESNCQWNLEHNIKADNSLYKENVVVITFDNTLEKRYFYFMQQGSELILYNYYLNDWYDKIEYRKGE